DLNLFRRRGNDVREIDENRGSGWIAVMVSVIAEDVIVDPVRSLELAGIAACLRVETGVCLEKHVIGEGHLRVDVERDDLASLTLVDHVRSALEVDPR